MLHNIDFELSALIFLIVLIIFYKMRNRLSINQNRYFDLFMIVLLISSISNMFSVLVTKMYGRIPLGLCYFVNIVAMMFVAVSIIAFFLYTLSITHKLRMLLSIKYLLLFIPAITYAIALIISPKTKAIFYINEAGRVVETNGIVIIPLVACFYAFVSLVFIFIYKKQLSNAQQAGLYIFIGLYISSGIIQYILDMNTFLVYFACTLGTLILYFAVQNPDYYINYSNGLLNREAFKLIVDEELENNTPFNCISIQLDEFSTLTEIYGTRKCDQLVKEIGTFLRKAFPKTNVFAISNSQYIIIDVNKVDFPIYDQVISSRFAQKWVVMGTEVKVNKSMCCLSYPEYYGNIDELLGIIKFALEESFKINSMVIIGDYIINKMNHNIAVEKAVEKAIEANAVQVYYQPIYSAAEKRITCAEALARLFDDDLGFIPPDEFIRVAEENGSILRLGQQIFEKVCVFIKNNNLQKLDIHYIEVNLSPIQCMQKELASELIAIADSYGLPMSNFNLEITESATTDSKDHVKINMEMLCNKNTTFSLDDYGTGFSNITAIMDLPFQYVKIDKSIVWAYFDNTNSILEHLVNMFKKENLFIITEGVETKEQCDKLLEMGCDFLQGFYFSKAIPGDDFISYISA